MKLKEAVYVSEFGPDPESVRVGLAWLVDVAEKYEHSTVNIVMPTMDSYVRGSVEDLLGERVAKLLSRGEPLDLGEGLILRPYSLKTMPFRLSGPVLAVYVSPKDLTQVDTVAGGQRMGIVALSDATATKWIKKHSARPIGGGSDDEGEPAEELNPVVAAAFENVTAMVNLGGGIGHQLDRDKVVHAFRILRKNGEEIDFDLLAGWLVDHNWASGYADQVVELGQRVYAGDGPQAGRSPFGPEVIKVWREQANHIQDVDK